MLFPPAFPLRSWHASWIDPGVLRMLRSLSALLVVVMLLGGAACGSTPPTAPTPTPTPAPGPSVGPQTAAAPSITAQPSGVTITAGETAALSVTAAGDGPLSYQWYAGAAGTTSAPVSGATGSSFTTPALQSTESYWVRVSNSAGSANSTAAVVTVMPAPAPPGPPPSGPDPAWVAFEDAVLALVNQQRASGAVCGSTTYPPVAALTMNPQLRAAARGHSHDMAVQGYFSHTSLDGRTFSQRIRDAGYMASPIAENIAAGYATPQSVMAGWMASSGHCSNIMSGSYKSIGIGYAYVATSPYGHYWTQDFGGQ